MKLDITGGDCRFEITREVFISMTHYNSLDYGQVLYIRRYSPVIEDFVDLYITITDFYTDEEGNGWVCGYFKTNLSDSPAYIEKLVAPNIDYLKES